MNRYVELWSWVLEVFGEKAFTLDEFRAVFPSPDPAKVVHDLAGLNLISRVETGTYKAVRPTELSRRLVEESMSKEKILGKTTKPYALSHDDAVRVWTDGYYWTGFTPGFKPVHIEVNKADVEEWERFFDENNADHAFEDERRTLFGLVFILHPVPRVHRTIKNGVPVIPLSRVEAFCKERVGTYGPALEYLQHKYGSEILVRQHVQSSQ
jgi:hypothetical protein